MRPGARFLFLALVVPLLVPSGLAQDDAPPVALGGPVQTVVDVFPRVVSRAIEEARRDGTPDAAEALVVEMNAFTAGFEHGGEWPEGTQAADWPVNDWLLYAVEVVQAAAEVPERVGAMERTDARCAGQEETASSHEVQEWGREVRAAELAVTTLVGSLEDLVARAPPVVDPAPLRSAGDVLSGWLAERGPRVIECVVTAEEERGLKAEPVLVVRATPRTIWPYGVLRLSGGSDLGVGTVVDLSSPGMGLDVSVTLDGNGTFRHEHAVPTDAEQGSLVVAARAGELDASAPVQNVRVPTRLLVAAPLRVDADAPFTVRVDVVPVEPVRATGEVVLEGADEERAVLENGSVVFALTAPSANGTLAYTIHYPGTAVFAPSESRHVVTVGSLEIGRASFVDDEPFQVDWVAVGIAVAVVLVALLVLVGVPRGLRRRAPPPGVAWGGAPPPDAPPSGPLVKVFSWFYAWAVRLGWARSSDTAREMAVKTGDERVVRSAHEFERVRYGGEAERPERSAAAAGWLRGVWGDRTKRKE